jgi:Fur family ferric uptake transcriptional regulator
MAARSLPHRRAHRGSKQRGIRGSKATVYRTLPLLAEAGILEPAILAGETRSYETTFGKHHHDHLRCGRCAKVVEFEFEAFEMLQREVAARHGFRLESHHHELIGTCPECLAKESAAPAPPAAHSSAPDPAPAGPAAGEP